MIVVGSSLLLLGFLLKVAILWTLGIIVLVVGLILLLLGSAGPHGGPAPPLLVAALIGRPRGAVPAG